MEKFPWVKIKKKQNNQQQKKKGKEILNYI